MVVAAHLCEGSKAADREREIVKSYGMPTRHENTEEKTRGIFT
jgi:hypothetical protein